MNFSLFARHARRKETPNIINPNLFHTTMQTFETATAVMLLLFSCSVYSLHDSAPRFQPRNLPQHQIQSSDTLESSPVASEAHTGGFSRRNILTSMAGGVFLFGLPSPSIALTASEASKTYDSYASNYDSLDGGSASNMLGIDQARADLFKQAKGKVLEIGAGTGLNLEKYDFSKIESLTLLDISQGMLSMAEKRWKNMTVDTSSEGFISFVQADATSELVSKFGAQSFDTVVDSFSLCTMGNDGAEKCLSQLSRVVKSNEQGGMSDFDTIDR